MPWLEDTYNDVHVHNFPDKGTYYQEERACPHRNTNLTWQDHKERLLLTKVTGCNNVGNSHSQQTVSDNDRLGRGAAVRSDRTDRLQRVECRLYDSIVL